MRELKIPIWADAVGDKSPLDTARRFVEDYKLGKESEPMLRVSKILTWAQGTSLTGYGKIVTDYYERVYEIIQGTPYSIPHKRKSQFITNSLLK